MTQRLIKSWWLLAVCGVLDAVISLTYLVLQETSGPFTYHKLLVLGRLTLLAGLCTVAAGVWSFRKPKSWLLALNGLACSALGAVFAFWTGPLAFRTVALLVVVMALSVGIYELITARTLRHLPHEWLIRASGVASIGFALAFLAFVFRWIKLQPGSPTQSLHWLSSYFACSAICMLVLSLRLPSLPDSARRTYL